ncbi:hypothetical protein Btru_078077 [Bulinus truncatus]|nr:hypothetical protein Btru_078077 [Bulinus truncatus]
MATPSSKNSEANEIPLASMKFLIVVIMLLNVKLQLVHCACDVTDWSTSFKKEGLSQCSNFIKGFVINDNKAQGNRDIGLLEGAECCEAPHPWNLLQLQTLHADWWEHFDSQRLVECPVGFFVRGLWRSGGNGGLHNIEEGKCSKPVDHPRQYKDCYLQDIRSCIRGKGTCRCRDNYFVAGLGREACNDLYCMTSLKCCQMMAGPEALDGKDKVKTSARCSGYKNDHRLSMEYGDWSFEMKNFTFGDPIVQSLEPEYVDSGVIHNNDSAPATKTVATEQTIIREVTNINTTYWRQIHELGISLRYRNPYTAGSLDYKFGYEESSTTYNSDNKQDSRKFTATIEKVVEPYSSKMWRVKIFKTKTIVPYTVKIAIKFSVKLLGFLRWGGGYNGKDTNYHVQYRGDDRRVTFNYKFGNEAIPFYADLLEQSNKHSPPWQWFSLSDKYPFLQNVISHLTTEGHYVFHLTGRFEDVAGTRMNKRMGASYCAIERNFPDFLPGNIQVFTGVHVAKSGPHDPPAVNDVLTEAVLDTSTLEEFDQPVEIPTSV